MDVLLDRLEDGPDGPRLRGGGVAVADVLRRLEAGEAPDRVGADLRLAAADVIAVLTHAALGHPDEPPLIQSTPRRPSLAGALSEGALAALLPRAPRPSRLAMAAGLLQVHDFWEASHEAAQQADDLGEQSFSAYWHGIAHRREPDLANATYWFRRVGRHPLFDPLAESARALIEAHDGPVPVDAARLVQAGAWDPFAMIDLCRALRPGSPAEPLARRLQRLELLALLDATASAALAG